MNFIMVKLNNHFFGYRLLRLNSTLAQNAVRNDKFVPKCPQLDVNGIKKLDEFVNNSKKLLVISGAGLSTESGIPDYRSEGVGLYSTSKNRPVQYSDFLKSEFARTRYWARNYVGWPIFRSFKPNHAHYIMTDWERKGKVFHHVTQNVDSLLRKAGCRNVTELHGCAHNVICIDCNYRLSRDVMQVLIHNLNKDWSAISNEIAPDSDVQLTEEQIKGFTMPKCPSCNSTKIKPELVFFGDNVPKPIVEDVKSKVENADAILVLGSSLQTYSAYRIILQAKQLNLPVAIVTIGTTRADDLADFILHARCSEALNHVKL